jgi:S-formylglutathione hydrolase FrmB
MRNLAWLSRLRYGFRRVYWHSASLGRRVEMLVYTPPGGSAQVHPRWPVLFLLHGSGHSPGTVYREAKPQACVSELGGAILVIPEGQQGWWLDSPVDGRSCYESYLLELVGFIDSQYPTEPSRESHAVCGFSMGGFGAMLLAARHPQLFGTASSLLGPLDIRQWHPDYYRLQALLGPSMAVWEGHNPTSLCDSLRDTRLLFTTGSEAMDRSQNEAFAAALRAKCIAHEYRVFPGWHDTGWVREHLSYHFAFHGRCFRGTA